MSIDQFHKKWKLGISRTGLRMVKKALQNKLWGAKKETMEEGLMEVRETEREGLID